VPVIATLVPESIKRSNVKVVSAVIGGGAVIAMAQSSWRFVQAGADVVANSSNMNIGSTSTETTPSNVPAVALTDWSAIASPAAARWSPPKFF
jgi:hypothetical protein